MAARYDVAGRLAEGQAAVDDMQTYVSAGQMRGYVNADLTLHSGQVREWYDTEEGLNLRLLDADCDSLRAVAQTAEEVLRVVRDQAAALDHAWTGGGGGAAAEFLRRHSAAGTEVADALRRAAQAYSVLRDHLWDVVDRKVGATVSIDDRTRSQRAGWLTAARAVHSGAPDDTSIDVVDTQVKPFVDNDIRGEWVPAMRSATSEVAAAYRVATDAVDSRAVARFEVPGDLGPRYVLPPAAAPAVGAPAAPVSVRPAAATAVEDSWPVESAELSPESAPIAAAAPAPAAAPPPPAPAPPSAPLAPTELPSSAPSLGSLPSLGGGGSGGGLPDMGGLLGDLFGGSPDAPSLDPMPESLPDKEIDEPDLKEPTDDTDDTGDTGDTEKDEEPDPAEAAVEEPVDDCPPEPEQDQPPPAAVVAPDAPEAPPVPAPDPPAAPVAAPAGETPCDIAADELPQAGE